MILYAKDFMDTDDAAILDKIVGKHRHQASYSIP